MEQNSPEATLDQEAKQFSEITDFIKDIHPQLLQSLESLSLDKLDCLGFQEITIDHPELYKFNFNNQHPLPPEDKKRDNIVFTGQGLCGLGTFILGKLVQSKFPEAELDWITIWPDRTERDPKEYKTIGDPHHLLSLKVGNLEPYLVDSTYTQIKHQKLPLKIFPLRELSQHYRLPDTASYTRYRFSQAESMFLNEMEGYPVTKKDLEKVVEKLSSA